MSSIPVATLGTPRIGPRRELKSALEAFWAGRLDAAGLDEAAAGLRAANWARQKGRGVDIIPSNDFSLYDHVLDTSCMVGAVPSRFGHAGGPVDLATYFAMARGRVGDDGVAALEMTKWFDTNYHYLVPEFSPGQTFALSSDKPVAEYREAKALGYETRPVLVGPVTYLLLGKTDGFDVLDLLPALLPVYIEVLRELAAEGAEWVQIDEPCLVLDLSDAARAALVTAYEALAGVGPKIMLATYFGALGDNAATALALPVAGIHLDLVRAPEQLALVEQAGDKVVSLGVVDGRNVWRADLARVLARLEPAVRGRSVQLAPSCSLLHVPIDLAQEDALDPDVRWLAFAVQKMDELATLAAALSGDRYASEAELIDATAAATERRTSAKVHDAAVAARLAAVTPDMARRENPFPVRRAVQAAALNLPRYPTTTIGSFPQTAEVRKARADHGKGLISDAEYDAFLARATDDAVRWQEEVGIDMLVHGEFERNDMVQYFGEQLTGVAFTRHGWVQSYGSRYVRPPIIFGDVTRPEPMTVRWSAYAASRTQKPMKGMLTGPVTMLKWSFIRDDVPSATVCRQMALALRDEVADLEAAGIKAIQVDEPALREGLPLRRADWAAYLGWAVEAFRLATASVRDETQIHTHMCYAEFNDIIADIAAMDADVISIETSRSRMELLEAFETASYPNDIGPGVWDIHSPRIPSTDEMVALLERAAQRLSPDQLWVNPDCGLKTRGWAETKTATENMVAAARRMRQSLAAAAE